MRRPGSRSPSSAKHPRPPSAAVATYQPPPVGRTRLNRQTLNVPQEEDPRTAIATTGSGTAPKAAERR
ncbi:hypothetical protein [Streptomyces sp. NBC_00989]|uniref:hypothetical protein n=1 Tax=Streptomyces sp. NBC_00989 TaxID=2903705 RepID=UPI00386C2DAA|nr:hypothetical protein OG714_04200 [Streptomyces sp. NBC_00989]